MGVLDLIQVSIASLLMVGVVVVAIMDKLPPAVWEPLAAAGTTIQVRLAVQFRRLVKEVLAALPVVVMVAVAAALVVLAARQMVGQV
jgi:hypothetical protein